jgi:hypothetical protein
MDDKQDEVVYIRGGQVFSLRGYGHASLACSLRGAYGSPLPLGSHP